MRAISFLACIGMLAFPLAAQNLSSVVVSVPFSFTVANQTIPPGEYRVVALGSATAVRLSTKDGKVNVSVIALGSSDPNDKPASFVFNKYGDRYFLAQVHRDDGIGWFVPRCKMERELVTSRVTAHSGLRVEQVTVLARVR